jgi:hypothetical protein
LLAGCSCTFEPPPLSEQAQVKAYVQEIAELDSHSPDQQGDRPKLYEEAGKQLRTNFDKGSQLYKKLLDDYIPKNIFVSTSCTAQRAIKCCN